MFNRQTKLVGMLGLGILLTSSGCGAMMHRSTVPPAPKSPRLSGPSGENGLGFSSDPHPSQTGQLVPTGPIANSGSPYGGGTNLSGGKGPKDSEFGSPPLGEPSGSGASNGSSMPPPGTL